MAGLSMTKRRKAVSPMGHPVKREMNKLNCKEEKVLLPGDVRIQKAGRTLGLDYRFSAWHVSWSVSFRWKFKVDVIGSQAHVVSISSLLTLSAINLSKPCQNCEWRWWFFFSHGKNSEMYWCLHPQPTILTSGLILAAPFRHSQWILDDLCAQPSPSTLWHQQWVQNQNFDFGGKRVEPQLSPPLSPLIIFCFFFVSFTWTWNLFVLASSLNLMSCNSSNGAWAWKEKKQLEIKWPNNLTKAQSTQDARRDAKQMGPVDVNRSVHTAHKKHQTIWVRICTRASCVDWALAAVSTSGNVVFISVEVNHCWWGMFTMSFTLAALTSTMIRFPMPSKSQ